MARKRNDSIDVLTDALAGALAVWPSRTKKSGPETRAVRFARGLAMGALVGAALTGLLRYRWGRRQDRRTTSLTPEDAADSRD